MLSLQLKYFENAAKTENFSKTAALGLRFLFQEKLELLSWVSSPSPHTGMVSPK